MTRKSAQRLAVLAAVLTLAGCGGSSAVRPTGKSAASPAAPVVPSVAASKPTGWAAAENANTGGRGAGARARPETMISPAAGTSGGPGGASSTSSDPAVGPSAAPDSPPGNAPGGPGVPGAAGGPNPASGGGGNDEAGHPDGEHPEGSIRQVVGTPEVALTFDDGPSEHTPEVLAMLREHRIKATFCVIGVNVVEYPDYVRQIVSAGHTMCNHTWSHDLNIGRRSPETIRADLQRTNDAIHQAAPGVPIEYYRNPGGNFTPASVGMARELGMASIGWTVDPWDWNTARYGTGASMAQHVVGSVQGGCRPGAIVLAHDGGGDRTGTVSAFRTLLPWLKERYSLVALPVSGRKHRGRHTPE